MNMNINFNAHNTPSFTGKKDCGQLRAILRENGATDEAITVFSILRTKDLSQNGRFPQKSHKNRTLGIINLLRSTPDMAKKIAENIMRDSRYNLTLK